MIQKFYDEQGNYFAHGTAKVIKEPRIRNGKYPVCNITAEVEAHPTGEKDERGRNIYENTLMSFTAFGKLARYCANLEKKDVFAFYGRLEPDEFWTEKNGTGEVAYKCVLEYVSVQPGNGAGADGGYYPGNLPAGWDEEPPY